MAGSQSTTPIGMGTPQRPPLPRQGFLDSYYDSGNYQQIPNYQYVVPQSQRPQTGGAAYDISSALNSAFSGGGGGSSYSYGGSTPMQNSSQNQYGIVPRNNYRSPTLLDMGNAAARQGAGFLWGGFNAAPGNIANDINAGFDQYQAYTDRQSDRQLKQNIINALMSGLGGLGGGNRMNGFVDMNSGQAASLPGQTTNAITATALSPQQIAGAAQQARGATSAPATRGTPNQASEVNQIAQQSARNRGSQNANTIDRTLTADNANLQRAIELAKSRQGLGNAGFLTDLNQDNVQREVAMTAPLIRALLSGLA